MGPYVRNNPLNSIDPTGHETSKFDQWYAEQSAAWNAQLDGIRAQRSQEYHSNATGLSIQFMLAEYSQPVTVDQAAFVAWLINANPELKVNGVEIGISSNMRDAWAHVPNASALDFEADYVSYIYGNAVTKYIDAYSVGLVLGFAKDVGKNILAIGALKLLGAGLKAFQHYRLISLARNEGFYNPIHIAPDRNISPLLGKYYYKSLQGDIFISEAVFTNPFTISGQPKYTLAHELGHVRTMRNQYFPSDEWWADHEAMNYISFMGKQEKALCRAHMGF